MKLLINVDDTSEGGEAVKAAIRVGAKRQFRRNHPEFSHIEMRDDFRYQGKAGGLVVHLDPTQPKDNQLTAVLRELSIEEMEFITAFLLPYLRSP